MIYIFFSYSTQDVTAVSTGNIDYDRVTGSLVLFNKDAVNGTRKQISVQIIEDTRTESTETFTVTLSAVNGGGLVPTNPFTADVNIIDNDGIFTSIFFTHIHVLKLKRL